MKTEPNDIVELRRRVAKAKELSEFNHQIGFDNRGNHVLGAFLTGVLQEYDTLRAERDEWKNRAEKAERRVFEERTNRAFAVRAVETERDDVIAICRGTQMDDAAITSMRKYVEEKIRIEDERDALLKVYESAEDFIGAQGTQYESDQYLMLCGVVGAYNQQRGIHES